MVARDFRSEVKAATTAGAVYFAAVFAIGFVLGALRVTVVVPRLGETAAVTLEAPVILAFSWAISRHCVRRFAVRAAFGLRFYMGAVAFALLMAAELGVSVFVFGRSLAEHVAAYRTIAGAIGFAAQFAFAFLPLLQGPLERNREFKG